MRLFRALFFALLSCAAAWAQTATITPAATTYAAAGGSLSFAVNITYSEPTASVGTVAVRLRLPSGWSFVSTEGPNPPQVAPFAGNTSAVDFAYTSTPASPINFSFTLNYSAGLSGAQVFTEGLSVIRITGGVAHDIAIPNITLTAAGSGGGDPVAVAPTITTQPQPQSVNEGQGTSFSVTASGTAPLSYQWRKDGVALAGVTTSSLVFSSVTASSAGVYSVVVSNAAGSLASAGAALTVKSAGQAPQILNQPRSVATVVGSAVALTVTATGAAPLTYQWRKEGNAITGATTATLNLPGQLADAGSYTVVVGNSAGVLTSNAATVTVSTTPLPVAIVTPPAAQTAAVGGTASFSVVASGSGPLTYQWQKDGVAIATATTSTLNLPNLTASAAGTYRVTVANATSTVTSAGATLTVSSTRGIAGTYLGSFGGNGGSIALLIRSDRTGVLLGFASGARLALLSREIVVDASGRFSAVQPDPRPAATSNSGGTPPIAAHEGEFHFEGAIAVDGSVAGTVSGLNLSFTVPGPAAAGATAGVAGFYQAGAVGGSAQSYAMVTPAGQALVVNVTGVTADGGVGTVTAAGSLAVTTAANATVSGVLLAESATLSTTVTSAAGTQIYAGANNDARGDIEKLINISTRSQTGTTANTLIAGFVIAGDAPKPVLVRAIGPTLGTAFNVTGALSAARLEIFRGATSIAIGDEWGAPAAGAPSAATIAATTTRVGAFGLPAGSRDSALLLTLEPGAYTAVVTGQGGANGVCLVEVYDATEGAIPRARRIINIATRATAGTGDNALIAGFYVNGTVPKRLLIRGVGPALAQFGVTGVLARPQLAVNSGAAVLAQNAGWSTSPDAATLATSAALVGAFAFAAGSADAALILHLAPGAYTAQVSGFGNTTGVALVEVYELP